MSAGYIIASIALVALAASVLTWYFTKRAFWGALVALLALIIMASFGLLWWWVPAFAAGVLLIAFIIAALASNKFSRGFMMTAAVVGVFAISAVGLNGLAAEWGVKPDSAAASDGGGISTIAFDPELDALPDEAKCTTDLFVDHSIRTVEPGNPEKKQFSTAVSIPLKGADDAAVMSEIHDEICGNPTELVMVVDDMLLWDDSQIPGAEANKGWLNEIKASITDAPTGINSFVEVKTDEAKTKIVTPLFQKYAAWVNTVLLRSMPEGQQSLESVRNWEISAAWAPNTGLPVAQQASVQENKPAWVRVFKDKMDNCLLRFGWNVEDRRLEIFNCVQPVPEQPEQPGTPDNPGTPGTPGTPDTPDTPDNPVCPWNPSLPPDSPNCLQPKDWSKSPDAIPGVTPLGPGAPTNGNESEQQHQNGDVSGNVTDNPVKGDTKTGDTTPDLPKGTVTAPGGNSGGGSQAEAPRDTENTKDDTGGTNGNGEIAPPPD